jgi:hypothetical protein
MGIASESSVTIHSGHKCDPLIEVRYTTNLLKLTFENKNVGQVNGFTHWHRADKNIHQAERVKVAAFWMLA